MFFTSVAHAMAPAGQGAEGGAALTSLVPLILMIAVFYFLLIRPQQKRAKEHKAMLGALKRGDAVVTAGGLYGKIAEVGDDTVVVDLGDAKVTVGRSYVSAVLTPKGDKGSSDKSKKDS